MRLVLASIFLLSFSAFANDIIKVTDGGAAYCKTKADVLRYQTSGVYRPLKFVRTEDEATVTVEFLRCVQKGEKFLFVRDDSFEGRQVNVLPGPFSRQAMTVSVERKDIAAVTFSSRGRVFSRGEMKRNADHTYSQTMPIELATFEANRNGEHFFEMTVSYQVKVTDELTGVVIDSKTEFLGSYRVYVK